MSKELVSIIPEPFKTSFPNIYEAIDYYQQLAEATKPFWYDTTQRLTGLMVQVGIQPPELLHQLLDLPQDYLHVRDITETLQAEIRHFKVYRRLARYVHNHKEGSDYHLSQADPQKLITNFKSINRAIQSSQLFDADQKRQVEEWLIGTTDNGGYIEKSIAADIILARTTRLGDIKSSLTLQDRRTLRDAHINLARVEHIIAPVIGLFEPPIAKESPALPQAA